MGHSITGHTRLAGIVGWPLEHTLSPVMHNAAYQALGLDWAYVPIPVKDESQLVSVLETAVAADFAGLNITMPHKRAVLGLCDDVATPARMAGAVNTVHVADGRLIGYNTDGRGLLESLAEDAGFDPAGRSVALLGAGGAAGAAFVAMVLANASEVAVVNRSPERAEALIERMTPHLGQTLARSVESGSDAEEAIRSADLVVNATPVGMQPDDPSPVDAAWLSSGQVIADMVYTPHRTGLTRAAEAAGAVAVDGLGMLVCQGALAIEIWAEDVNVRAPRDIMREAAAAAVGPQPERTGR